MWQVSHLVGPWVQWGLFQIVEQFWSWCQNFKKTELKLNANIPDDLNTALEVMVLVLKPTFFFADQLHFTFNREIFIIVTQSRSTVSSHTDRIHTLPSNICIPMLASSCPCLVLKNRRFFQNSTKHLCNFKTTIHWMQWDNDQNTC